MIKKNLIFFYSNDLFISFNIKETEDLLEKNNLNKGIIIDVSHDNSLFENKKDYKKQIDNIKYILNEWKINKNMIGVMIESNINEGKQSIDNKPLKKGVSITDGCINLSDTYNILKIMNTTIDN